MFVLGGKKVFFTDRSFTSGLPTSEVTFYVQQASGRIGKFLALPMQLREHKIEQHGDKIVLTTYDEVTKSWLEVMSISSAMLKAAPFKLVQDDADRPEAASKSKSAAEKKP